MKYEVRFTTQFKKDLKLAKKQGKDIAPTMWSASRMLHGLRNSDSADLGNIKPTKPKK